MTSGGPRSWFSNDNKYSIRYQVKILFEGVNQICFQNGCKTIQEIMLMIIVMVKFDQTDSKCNAQNQSS